MINFDIMYSWMHSWVAEEWGGYDHHLSNSEDEEEAPNNT